MTGLSAAMRGVCDRRAGGRCERCGEPLGDSFSRHHRRPRGMGGSRRPDTNLPANIGVLCGSATTGCHGWVEYDRARAVAEGWLVPSWQTPTEAVVWYRGAWCRLHDDGSVQPVESLESA